MKAAKIVMTVLVLMAATLATAADLRVTVPRQASREAVALQDYLEINFSLKPGWRVVHDGEETHQPTLFVKIYTNNSGMRRYGIFHLVVYMRAEEKGKSTAWDKIIDTTGTYVEGIRTMDRIVRGFSNR